MLSAGHPLPHTFLALLSEGERAGLDELGMRRRFQRRTVLMFQHDPDERVMLLLDGRVKVTRVDQDGRELLLSIRDPGDVLGELAFIDGQPRTATVTALESVEALVTPGPEFRRHLECTPRIATVLLEILARRFRESTLKLAQLAALDTMGRVSARVLELADRYGEPSDGAVSVRSPLTQEDLAAWTGASRAGVAQALRVMRELGWVQTKGRELRVLDPPALRARAS